MPTYWSVSGVRVRRPPITNVRSYARCLWPILRPRTARFFLIGKGAAAEAAEVLEKGLDFVNKRNNAFYRYQLYEKLSEAYELADRPRTALKYYKNYHHEFDSIFNVERLHRLHHAHHK